MFDEVIVIKIKRVFFFDFRFWQEYKKKLETSHTIWHDLVDYSVMSDVDLTGNEYYECRVLPKELSNPMVICIYEDKVANIFWDGQKTTINVMQNQGLAKSYLQYFDHLWKLSS